MFGFKERLILIIIKEDHKFLFFRNGLIFKINVEIFQECPNFPKNAPSFRDFNKNVDIVLTFSSFLSLLFQLFHICKKYSFKKVTKEISSTSKIILEIKTFSFLADLTSSSVTPTLSKPSIFAFSQQQQSLTWLSADLV